MPINFIGIATSSPSLKAERALFALAWPLRASLYMIAFFLTFCLTLSFSTPASAQMLPSFNPLVMPAKDMNYLVIIAQEPLLALLEDREVRMPREDGLPRSLSLVRPMAVTLRLNGQILARAFEIRSPAPLSVAALALGAKVMTAPDVGRPPELEELPNVKVAVAVLDNLTEAASDADIGPDQAVVVLNGFTIAVGLPSDLPPQAGSFALLSNACELFGLRKTIWLSDKSSLMYAPVTERMGQELGRTAKQRR
ncbi:MAG: hypothetical protein LBJ64_07935 [Deltaproteobacteria bacterium]|jgi:hypothetical protein|nr:hypothetical protein [Deltaproteobacteria bacterium]